MSQQHIEQVELSIEQARYVIGLGDSLEKLLKNREFKKIILERYIEQESQRLVLMKSDPTQQTPEAQKMLDNQIMAIGGLNNFMRMLQQQAQLAAQALRDDEDTLAELLAEQIEE